MGPAWLNVPGVRTRGGRELGTILSLLTVQTWITTRALGELHPVVLSTPGMSHQLGYSTGQWSTEHPLPPED